MLANTFIYLERDSSVGKNGFIWTCKQSYNGVFDNINLVSSKNDFKRFSAWTFRFFLSLWTHFLKLDNLHGCQPCFRAPPYQLILIFSKSFPQSNTRPTPHIPIYTTSNFPFAFEHTHSHRVVCRSSQTVLTERVPFLGHSADKLSMDP